MTIDVPIIRVHQNSWNMYIGIMYANDVFALAESDRIRLEKIKIPKYAGFQRPLVKERVDEIEDYLSTPESNFPNSIIVSLDSSYITNWDDLESNDAISILKIEKQSKVLTIIDGQHRAAALKHAKDDFQVILTIFVDLDLMKAAEIFAKINSTQKAVNPSIAFQLFGYSDKRSPQKTAHDIAETLNTTEGSPFFKKLRMLGTKDDWAEGTLSQSTFSKQIMRLYTKDYQEDENALLRDEKLNEYKNYPLRKYFIHNNDDKILEIVWRYYYNVAKCWPDQWDSTNKTSILTKTTGYIAFIEVLQKILNKVGNEEREIELVTDNLFNIIKSKYEAPSTIFVRDNYPAGHQGVKKLRDSVLRDLNIE